MKHDIGLHDHDLPFFTRCASREEARREARLCALSDPRFRTAISAMKGLSSDGDSAVPGFFVNHFARRLFPKGIESSLSSLVVFQRMVQYFFAFCRLQDIIQWPANRSELAEIDRACLLEDSSLDELDQKSEILMDLLRDNLNYDEANPGSNRVFRFGRTCRRARDQLCKTFQAIADNDKQYLSDHFALKDYPFGSLGNA